MGSRARVVVYAPEEPVEPVRRAFGVIDACDRALSDYNPNSESRALTGGPAGVWQVVSPLLASALARSWEAHGASGGAFDVTIGAVTAAWRASHAAGRAPTEEELAAARTRVGMAFVEVDEARARVRLAREGMRLDFGGIGKGLAADLALESLRADGLGASLVEIGGDLAAGDPPPGAAGWAVRVGDAEGVGASLVLVNEGAATSGDAFRFVEVDGARGSHIMDPGTARPAPTGGAITVVAREGWVADAVATVARLRGDDAARVMGARLGGVRLVPSGE